MLTKLPLFSSLPFSNKLNRQSHLPLNKWRLQFIGVVSKSLKIDVVIDFGGCIIHLNSDDDAIIDLGVV